MAKEEASQPAYYRHRDGELLLKRWKVVGYLGKGTFSTVLKCSEAGSEKMVAVKVSRQEPKYHDAGMRELQTLIFLKRKDPGERYHCIRARRWFELGGHVFAVYDLLGPSVLNLMRIAPLSRAQLAHAARQLTECIASLLHSVGLAHTDIKPENVLTVPDTLDKQGSHVCVPRFDVKMVDFGSALFESEMQPRVMTTRSYRAPEVFARVDPGRKVDVWSLGCMLYEMRTRRVLFRHGGDDPFKALILMSFVLELAVPAEYEEAMLRGAIKLGVAGRWIRARPENADGVARALEQRRARRRLEDALARGVALPPDDPALAVPRSVPLLPADLLDSLEGMVAEARRAFAQGAQGAQGTACPSSRGSPMPPPGAAGGLPAHPGTRRRRGTRHAGPGINKRFRAPGDDGDSEQGRWGGDGDLDSPAKRASPSQHGAEASTGGVPYAKAESGQRGGGAHGLPSPLPSDRTVPLDSASTSHSHSVDSVDGCVSSASPAPAGAHPPLAVPDSLKQEAASGSGGSGGGTRWRPRPRASSAQGAVHPLPGMDFVPGEAEPGEEGEGEEGASASEAAMLATHAGAWRERWQEWRRALHAMDPWAALVQGVADLRLYHGVLNASARRAMAGQDTPAYAYMFLPRVLSHLRGESYLYDLLKWMLMLSPSLRVSAEAALSHQYFKKKG